MLVDLFKSYTFSPYDFTDFPLCILYATMHGKPALERAAFIKSLDKLPPWIAQFAGDEKDVPVFHIPVYDGLSKATPPKEGGKNGTFSAVYPLAFRSRANDSQEGIDSVVFFLLFEHDDEILRDPKLGSFLTGVDIVRGRQVLNKVYSVAHLFYENRLGVLEKARADATRIRSKLKNFLRKKKSEKTPRVLGLRNKKIDHIRLASMLAQDGRYVEARREYKHFVISLSDTNPQLSIFGRYMAALCLLGIPEKRSKFSKAMRSVIQSITDRSAVRFAVLVSLLVTEVSSATNSMERAAEFCVLALNRLTELTPAQNLNFSLLKAIIFERLAGLDSNDRRCRLWTILAAQHYESADHFADALRCLIWVERILPMNSWKFLWQSVTLRKAQLLSKLNQEVRSIDGCKQLLALPDLDQDLHDQVLAQFWAALNNVSQTLKSDAARISSLLEVCWARLNDRSFPEFWGFHEREFRDILKKFDCTRVVKVIQSYEEMWLNRKSEHESVRVMRVGTEVRIAVAVRNRYTFMVLLEFAKLRAEYQGTEKRSEHYTIKPISEIAISARTRKPIVIEFLFTPLSEGTFIVNGFEMTYWSCVETSREMEPLTFVAARNWPALSMFIMGFPERSESGECHSFRVEIRSECSESIDDVLVVYDNNTCVVPLYEHHAEGSISVVALKGGLKPYQTTTIEFFYRADTPGATYLHFFATANGSRSAFAMSKCSVVRTRRIETRITPKRDDTANCILHCTMYTDFQPGTFSGIMNRSGKLLRTLGLADARFTCESGLSIVALTGDLMDESVEPWRVEIMEDCEYALLVGLEGRTFRAQYNLVVTKPIEVRRFKLEMKSSFVIGELISCTLIDMAAEGSCFVRPLPVKVADNEGATTLARWIGGSTRLINDRNNHRALFLLAAASGLLQITGFLVSQSHTFEQPMEIHIQHVFSVVGAEGSERGGCVQNHST
jgi:hypothetical protein